MKTQARVLVAIGALLFHLTVAAAPIVVAESAFRCEEHGRTEEEVVRTTLGGVPALVRLPSGLIRHAPIVLWHGFGPPESEAELMTALPLDDAPALKIYLGLPLFGERAPADGMKEVVRRQAEAAQIISYLTSPGAAW